MESTEFYTPLNKNAAYYRARARAMLQNNYGIALLAFFLASILGGAGAGGITAGLNFNLDAEDVNKLVSTEFIGYLGYYLPLLIAGISLGAITSIAFSLFVSSPVLLGYRRFFLALNDEEKAKLDVSTLFAYFTSATYWKSVLLNLLYSLIPLVAYLPLLAATVAACVLLFIPLMWPFAFLIAAAGGIVSALLALPIAYTYAYAHTIMAEYPTLTPVEALRNSRNLMRGNKWRLFCLDISFIGWILLSILTCGIGFIFLAPYMDAARVAFYHDIARRDAAKETEFPSLDPDDYTE